MPEFSVPYTVSGDFGGDDPDLTLLHQEYEEAEANGDFNGGDPSDFIRIERAGDDVSVIFDRGDGGPLPAGQQTTSDNLVANHDPDNPDANEDAKNINIAGGVDFTLKVSDPSLVLITASGVGVVNIDLPPAKFGKRWLIKRLDGLGVVTVNLRGTLGDTIDLVASVVLGVFPSSAVLEPYDDGYIRV